MLERQTIPSAIPRLSSTAHSARSLRPSAIRVRQRTDSLATSEIRSPIISKNFPFGRRWRNREMQTKLESVAGNCAAVVRVMNRSAANRTMIVAVAAWAAISGTPVAFAQVVQRSEAIASSDVLSQISMFSYRDGRKSDLFLRGTPIAANAQGTARVDYQNGNAQVSAKVKSLPKPASLGPYTTYVLWAVTPDGRASNMGVLAGADGGKGEMDTQYGASQFALIVTAEPHFAVTVPSTMIALYNVADDVEGAAESKVTTLTERADYSNLTGIAIDKTTPVEVVQARYSLAIAKRAGADRFATQSYTTATVKLAAAETALKGDSSQRKTAPGLAREAVTAGEDARRAGMLASAAAATEAQRQAAADAADQTAREVAAATEAQRETTANAANDASRAAAAASAQATVVAAAVAAEATVVAAQAAAASTVAATDAEHQKSATEAAVAARRDLLARLNAALPTRDSDRGLISEIGGVQFATGTADINGSARENLAKFSGIVASYPGLRFNVEGHTDSTGSVVTNQELSMHRAMTVRDYLVAHGVPASSIDVVGFGASTPLADNSTADGRARNRRVEIVLSGGLLAAR
jgi:outer membrane protein OmpA-like peptidoglycan-associated protein